MLASGSGTNLQALIDAGLPGLAVVISDVESAPALDRARSAGIPTAVVEFAGDRSRSTTAICDTAEAFGAKALVLAGFMRILSSEAIERFPDRILNIHPSLLPSFPGANAVARALAHGVKVTGVTVHFVNERVDDGPIVYQRAVPVLPGDDEATLHARLQEVEHDIYPRAVAALMAGKLQVKDGEVVWE